MSLPRQPVKSNRQTTLTQKDLQSKQDLIRYYQTQTEICKTVTGKTILTADEYKRASDDFKRLVDIPRNKGEPIYILPEFTANKKLHPFLQKLQDGIIKGTPYTTLITDNLGTTWPSLLRLYFGLTSGFNISAEQLHSLLKVCYWQELGFKVDSVPLFDAFGLSDLGEAFVESELYFPNKQMQKKQFLTAMKSSSILNGEKNLIVLRLSRNYYHALRYIITKYTQVDLSQILMADNFGLLYPGQPKYSETETINFIQTAAAHMFCAPFVIYSGYHKLIMQNGISVILPSQTMEQVYFKTVNPERNLKTVRLLGRFSTDLLEAQNDSNERAVNLFAPGISNPLLAHGKVVSPATGLLHDDYHLLFEATLKSTLTAQMNRGKEILRQVWGENKLVTSEILRLMDRECHPERSDEDRFYELIKYVFAENTEDETSKTRNSLYILLTDMVLSPQHWPTYSAVKEKLVKLVLNNITASKFEKITHHYAVKVNRNVSFTAILVLCHFTDPEFCEHLIKLSSEYPDLTLFGWKKHEHGCLYPVLNAYGNKGILEYELPKLLGLDSKTRRQLLKSVKVVTPSLPTVTSSNSADAGKPEVGEITITITEFDKNKESLINHLHGKVISRDVHASTVQIKSALLNQPVREHLGIDRVNLFGKERCTKLTSQGIVVEPLPERPNWYQLTFLKSQRALINAAKAAGEEKPVIIKTHAP